jgi:non-specific serine/threonine protein kinase
MREVVMAPGTSYRTPGTLPSQTSGFVGREAELSRVRELLRRSRLVTVAGTGGVGKTRLALRSAAEAAAQYPDGVHLIDLSAVRDHRLLVHALTAGLAVPGSPRGSQLDELLGFLRERELLLILDTCEHLVDGCAALSDVMLREAPGVTILATSRQPLDAAGEATFQLHPLPVPDQAAGSAGKADAVELFAQRAAAAVPGFTVTPENLADIITVCRRLDGIPLAIELATVRLRALPLRQMADHIDDRLRLLTGGRRTGTPRHQTLRAAIEWSHSLCTPAEQLLWARLSVFACGFDLAAAEQVCAGGALAAAEVVPALISLVDKNVLTADGTPDAGQPGGDLPAGPAYRMPGTIREFGAERLRLAGPHAVAEAAVRRKFIAHYLALAERFAQSPETDQLGQYQRLRREHPNLRAAFDFALSLPGNDGAAIVLADSLFVYWRISGLLREAEYWLDQALGLCPQRSLVRARVLSTRGYVRVVLGDFANGRADAEAAVALAAIFSDQAAAGRAYSALHRALAFGGNLAAAQAAAQAATEALTADDDVLGLAQLDIVDAMLRLQTGEPGLCCASAARGLDRLPPGELWCTSYLEGLLSVGLFLRGDHESAKVPGRRALATTHRLNDVMGMAFGLGGLAFIAAGEGRYERTAWLFGASEPLWERTGRWYTGSPAYEALHQVAERVARSGLGDDRFWRLRAAGAAAPLDEAIALALGDTDTFDEPA